MGMRSQSATAILSGAVVVVLLGAFSLVAQETTKAQETPKETKASKGKKKAEPKGQVPPYFGDVGLTQDQKETIYKIREKHKVHINDLEKQLKSARADELTECESVLTETQKELLAQRRRAADEAKAAAKKKSAEEKAAKKLESAKAEAAKPDASK